MSGLPRVINGEFYPSFLLILAGTENFSQLILLTIFHYPIRNGISHKDLEQIANRVVLDLVHGLYD